MRDAQTAALMETQDSAQVHKLWAMFLLSDLLGV